MAQQPNLKPWLWFLLLLTIIFFGLYTARSYGIDEETYNTIHRNMMGAKVLEQMIKMSSKEDKNCFKLGTYIILAPRIRAFDILPKEEYHLWYMKMIDNWMKMCYERYRD